MIKWVDTRNLIYTTHLEMPLKDSQRLCYHSLSVSKCNVISWLLSCRTTLKTDLTAERRDSLLAEFHSDTDSPQQTGFALSSVQ